MIPIDLTGKAAVVTGSSRGIGRACALILARAGADVAINYATNREAGEATLREIEAIGGKGTLVKCDVADTGEVEAMVRGAETAFGHVDILVNNAGVGSAKTAEDLSDDEYKRVFDVNVRAYVAAARAALTGMKARKSGRIICISSIVGRSGRGFIGTSPAYAGAKGAVISFTRALAREAGSFGITANCICPGWIDWEGKDRKVAPELRARAISEMPMGRVGSDDDIAGACLFLASDYSSYVTGVSLDVNGGLYMA
jgi:3-oxoacyl-[acyl-carrier protein] reductase